MSTTSLLSVHSTPAGDRALSNSSDSSPKILFFGSDADLRLHCDVLERRWAERQVAPGPPLLNIRSPAASHTAPRCLTYRAAGTSPGFFEAQRQASARTLYPFFFMWFARLVPCGPFLVLCAPALNREPASLPDPESDTPDTRP